MPNKQMNDIFLIRQQQLAVTDEVGHHEANVMGNDGCLLEKNKCFPATIQSFQNDWNEDDAGQDTKR